VPADQQSVALPGLHDGAARGKQWINCEGRGMSEQATTDRELLEAAAKAAGYAVFWPAQAERAMAWEKSSGVSRIFWNPLDEDGDALRLAVKLQLTVCNEHVESGVVYCTRGGDVFPSVPSGDTQIDVIAEDYVATRRAIVCAAAELAKDTDHG
jgi:hypothetical protein